jgi:hypothetical protein
VRAQVRKMLSELEVGELGVDAATMSEVFHAWVAQLEPHPDTQNHLHLNWAP